MKINRYVSRLMLSNMYVIVEKGHAIIIDPFEDITPADNLIVDKILLTHEHYDHISGVNKWKNITGAPVLCSKACASNIKDPRKNMSRYFDTFCLLQTLLPAKQTNLNIVDYCCEADLIFEDMISLQWQEHTITMLEIPGHSLGSIGIYVDESDFFSGDSLFKDFEIELHLPGGSVQKWEEIGKKRIEAVPCGTKIWPGHFEDFIKHNEIKEQ